jgi:hypothetical protein
MPLGPADDDATPGDQVLSREELHRELLAMLDQQKPGMYRHGRCGLTDFKIPLLPGPGVQSWCPTCRVADEDWTREPDRPSFRDEVIASLIGAEGKPGLLDQYFPASHKGLVVWACRRCPHINIIASDFKGSQADLTLGEVVTTALEHEKECHDG